MATFKEIVRKFKIIDFVSSHNYPTRQNILEYLENRGYSISKRTLVDDLTDIRFDFRIELVYSRAHKGYYIDENESDRIDSFFRFLEIVSIADIFNESLKDNNKILEFVSFDDSKWFRGIDNLRKILLAISQERKLSFKHHSYQKENINHYEITPLKLKEYQNRWYVLGVVGKRSDVWSFGVDRMSELEVSDPYERSKDEFKTELQKYYDIVGVSFELGDLKEKIKVELLADEEHAKYLDSLPLHHSQVIQPFPKDGKYEVEYFLIPNYEFKTQILKMGTKAEVISPIELRNEIKGMLQSTLDYYN